MLYNFFTFLIISYIIIFINKAVFKYSVFHTSYVLILRDKNVIIIGR